MGEIKIKYIGAVVAMALVFSIYVGVNAKETKVEPVEKVVVTQKVWYEVSKINPTGPDAHSNYQIDAITSAPATGTNPASCTQDNTTGKFCAYELEFDAGEDPNDALEQTVADAMDLLEASESGHARNPSLP